MQPLHRRRAGACIGIVLIFNVMRAVPLFYLEAVAGEPMESWQHGGVGLISFAMALPLRVLTVESRAAGYRGP